MQFIPGKKYSRPDIKEIAGLDRSAKGGDWDTGIVEHEGEFVIFSNIGTTGRTGHSYTDHWEGADLWWQHKSSSRLAWPSVTRLLEQGRRVHIFWRVDNDQPFKYAGLGVPLLTRDTSPVEVLWRFGVTTGAPAPIISSPEEPATKYKEGKTRQIVVNAYERDPRARSDCLKHHGYRCSVCDFSFESVYGELGVDFIHVHHLLELADVGEEYDVDPIADLRPVCPNCHAMLHRRRPCLTIEELKTVLG